MDVCCVFHASSNSINVFSQTVTADWGCSQSQMASLWCAQSYALSLCVSLFERGVEVTQEEIWSTGEWSVGHECSEMLRGPCQRFRGQTESWTPAEDCTGSWRRCTAHREQEPRIEEAATINREREWWARMMFLLHVSQMLACWNHPVNSHLTKSLLWMQWEASFVHLWIGYLK